MSAQVRHGSHSLLDQGVPVGSQEVPGQFVAVRVPADGDEHVREVLQLHHLALEALLHHPADAGTGRSIQFNDQMSGGGAVFRTIGDACGGVGRRTHLLSLSCSGLNAIATFMRLFTDICRDERYLSNRKSHPSGVRAPTVNTAMVTSTGRLRTNRFPVSSR